MARYNRYQKGWAQRLGKIRRKDLSKKCIWIHAVSVGEVNATRSIVDELKSKFDDFELVMSTTTDTGFARASALYADKHTVFYFPLDFSYFMRRAFANIAPALCILMELEVWPNFIETANKLNVSVIIVNARITDRSLAKYRMIRPIAEKLFGKINLFLAQTPEYAARFRKIGAKEENVLVTGSLKYDTAQICDKVDGADVLAAEMGLENKKLWVAGATGNDEEEIILDVYRNLLYQTDFKDLRLVIVPRKPERFNEVAQIIKQKGFACLRYTEAKKSSVLPVTDNQTVILGDTMGDLRKFYSLAELIFAGRSLVPMGGSDMMEAAALGKCTIFGPYAFNFKQTVDALLAGNGALLVKNQNSLLKTVQKCLAEPDYAERIARNGRKIIKENQGATEKTIQQIKKILTPQL
jgi:3-deoxy-D-manno-octulosonic-acid transferase